jgi:hypothetical protein
MTAYTAICQLISSPGHGPKSRHIEDTNLPDLAETAPLGGQEGLVEARPALGKPASSPTLAHVGLFTPGLAPPSLPRSQAAVSQARRQYGQVSFCSAVVMLECDSAIVGQPYIDVPE